MYRIDGVRFNGCTLLYGVLDTKDNTVEYYTEHEIRNFVNNGFDIRNLDDIPKLRNSYNQKNFILGSGTKETDGLYPRLVSFAFSIINKYDFNYTRLNIKSELPHTKFCISSVSDVDFLFYYVLHQSEYPTFEPLTEKVVAHLDSLTKGVCLSRVKDARKLYFCSFYYLDKMIKEKDYILSFSQESYYLSDCMEGIDRVAGDYTYMSCLRYSIQRHGAYPIKMGYSIPYYSNKVGCLRFIDAFIDIVMSLLNDYFLSNAKTIIERLGYSVYWGTDKFTASINSNKYQSEYTVNKDAEGRYKLVSSNTNYTFNGGIVEILNALSQRRDYFYYRQELSMAANFNSGVTLNDKRKYLTCDFSWNNNDFMKEYNDLYGIVSYLFDIDEVGMFCQVVTNRLLTKEELDELNKDIKGQLNYGYGEFLDADDISSCELRIYQTPDKPITLIGRNNWVHTKPKRGEFKYYDVVAKPPKL